MLDENPELHFLKLVATRLEQTNIHLKHIQNWIAVCVTVFILYIFAQK